MSNVEENATRLLLELGVSVPVRTPRFLKRKRKPWSIVLHAPTCGNLMRIANKYLSMGVTYEQVKGYTLEQNMQFYREHGKTMSEMIACSVCGGYITGKLFNKQIGWFLRWAVHPVMLQEAWYQLITLLDTTSFQPIISSAAKINLTKPKLSHNGKGS